MQPLFEAISNAIHSTQARFTETVAEKGRVTVTIVTNRDKKDVWASVEDNGFGLNDENWDAFTTTDTDNKIRIGGKGVGRLLWLDCFEDIKIWSVYKSESATKKRDFKFVLALEEQIKDENISLVSSELEPSFFVKFQGLRPN
jgi:signal transduction histidine kinase